MDEAVPDYAIQAKEVTVGDWVLRDARLGTLISANRYANTGDARAPSISRNGRRCALDRPAMPALRATTKIPKAQRAFIYCLGMKLLLRCRGLNSFASV